MSFIVYKTYPMCKHAPRYIFFVTKGARREREPLFPRGCPGRNVAAQRPSHSLLSHHHHPPSPPPPTQHNKPSLVLYSTISSHSSQQHIFCASRGFMLPPLIEIDRNKLWYHPNPLLSTVRLCSSFSSSSPSNHFRILQSHFFLLHIALTTFLQYGFCWRCQHSS